MIVEVRLMNITLYNNSSHRRRVIKNLTLLHRYSNVHIKENTSILKPHFILTGIGSLQFNYLYCDYFNRYYFVDDVIYLKGGLYEIVCDVDPLYSHRSKIYNHKAYVTRCEHKFYKEDKDKYGIFYDSNYPVRSDVTVEPVDIGVVAYTKGYYLTVNGGLQ